MSQLNVPLLAQAEGSVDCGVACVAMLLHYYGSTLSIEEIKQQLTVFSWGTCAPQLGLFLLQQGFSVELVGLHPALFHAYAHFETQADLLAHLASLQGKLKGHCDEEVLQYFIRFIQAGGTLAIKVPSIVDIEIEIQAKRPLIALLTHWFLFKTDFAPRFTQHFNVVTGIDQDSIYVNDPDWGKPFGGQHTHARDLFMYAIYASALGAVDNASLLKVKK